MNQKYQRDLADKKGQQNNQGKNAQSLGGQENKKVSAFQKVKKRPAPKRVPAKSR